MVAATPSFAHGGFGSAGPFWAGALHLFVSPLAIVVTVAAAAALAFQTTEVAGQAVIGAAATCFLACWLLPSAVSPFAPLGGVVTGICAALAYKPKRVAALVLGTLAGLSIGAAIEFDSRGMAASAGASVAAFMLLAYSRIGLFRVGTKWPIAVRVVGAWIAAISLLVGALSLSVIRA